MSRWRIDFVVQELDVPPEQARGIKFGDDLELEDVIDFFERCRDAVRTLLGTRHRKTLEELKAELAEEARKAKAIQAAMRPAGVSVKPSRNPHSMDDFMYGDDGSRGGDGPPSPEWLAKVAAAKAGWRP